MGANIYIEKLSSARTTALFITLTLLSLGLTAWSALASGIDFLAGVGFLASAFFLFYTLNYRTLTIRLSPDHLALKFGLFTWTVPLEYIESCSIDDISLWRIGGAGIHFSPIRGRYRAMFNFLEYPRVVLRLQKKVGLARDIAFSTRQPQEVMRLIRGALETLPQVPFMAMRKPGESQD